MTTSEDFRPFRHSCNIGNIGTNLKQLWTSYYTIIKASHTRLQLVDQMFTPSVSTILITGHSH